MEVTDSYIVLHGKAEYNSDTATNKFLIKCKDVKDKYFTMIVQLKDGIKLPDNNSFISVKGKIAKISETEFAIMYAEILGI